MATVHAGQALFLAKQMVPSTFVFHFIKDQASIFSFVTTCVSTDWCLKTWDIESDCKWTSIHQIFSAKLPTSLIHQTFYRQGFLLYGNN